MPHFDLKTLFHSLTPQQQQLLFAGLLFGAVTLVVFLLIGSLFKKEEDPLKKRLRAPKPSDDPADAQQTRQGTAPAGGGAGAALMQRISTAASKPIMPKQREEQSRLRKRLAYAGIYTPSALPVFVGCKLILL